MLTNRQISENFEVQINTLYNWRKSKPRLYRYLQNADFHFERTQEMNVLLERLAREIRGTFDPEEILRVIESNLIANSIEEIENLDKLFVRAHAKRLDKEGDFILTIYDKLHALTLVEKYIFYKRIETVRADKNTVNPLDIREQFDLFCV